MKVPRNARLAVGVLLAAATAILSLLGVIALRSGGEARLGPVPLMKIAAGYDRSALPILAGPAIPSFAERRRAVALSHGAITQFPYDVSDWLRLAYVDDLDHGGLTPQGVADLRRSYDLIAVDSELGFWRVRFALENSQVLPGDVRASVRREVAAMWVNPNHRAQLRQAIPSIHNPAGRLSLALWLNRLDASVAR